MDTFFSALAAACGFEALLANLLGVALGIVFGALPGLTAVMGVALLIPLTFGLPPVVAFSSLLGMYCGAIYAGSITAILVSTPGTAAAAATMLEGPRLTARGESLRALEMTTVASFVGGVFSCFILAGVAPQLARFALNFSAPEYFALGIFGLTIVATLSEGALLKGCIAACLGLLIAMVGMDPLTGNLRLTFDSANLINGVSLIPALVGLYALSQVFLTCEDVFRGKRLSAVNISRKGISLAEIWANRSALLRGSLIGTFIGIVPATGSGTASFAAYSEAKRNSRHPEAFGNGAIEGLAATESANNAVTGGALIPLLTLGIPGDVVTAVILGALMIQGMTPGPLLFQEQGALVYSIFISLLLANVFMLVLGMASVRVFSKIVSIPGGILMPLVTTLCVVGGYALNNSNFDLGVMAVFGILGWIMTKASIPLAPLLLAMILSGIIETNFRRALSISDNDYTVFLTRPVCAVFLCISLFILFNLLRKEWKKAAARR
ncbi:tripartite tricarboxylate transporter permease [Desulfovibrio fairfieldensis]|uniref:C4-dicarboxylate ABC transporter permease n=1 Tax=Desulfovibrio fairfieldensis TaxID=44742 RepID=A0A0X8JLW5_9BACT|nr:tripartite tricarboxylate transporter permease [Desulfovibrio fairfieldensis]AMD90793.1 C4-dicarboxylate ABC transporter permease [Desulfovibrio fairfieldensis]